MGRIRGTTQILITRYNTVTLFRYRVNVIFYSIICVCGCLIGVAAYFTDREYLTPYAVITACGFGSASLLYKAKILNLKAR